MRGTMQQVQAMRDDWYVVAVFDGDELLRDSIIGGTPHDIAYNLWCYLDPGLTVEVTHEETNPLRIHPILRMDVGGRFEYEVLADAEWLDGMRERATC